MKRVVSYLIVCGLFVFGAGIGLPQQPDVNSAGQSTIPRLVNFSGIVKDAGGKARTGSAVLGFSLYEDQESRTPVWTETQTVQLDEQGHYTVQLGNATPDGLPLNLFLSGRALWLEVQQETEPGAEQPRILLVSVPYALKAADAETLGGKPASAYVTLEQQAASPGAGTEAPAANPATPTGMMRALAPGGNAPTACSAVTSDGMAAVNSIALFTTPCNIEQSPLFGVSGKVGLGTANPSAYLDLLATTTAASSTVTIAAQGFRGSITANPASASLGVYEGVRGQAYDVGATNRVGTLKGFVSQTNTTSNQTVDGLYGLYSTAQVSKSGGTATNAYGIYADAVETSGNLTNGYGLFAQAQGTMTTAYGLYSSVGAYGSGKPVNGYGVYVAPLAVTGTSFGLYQGGSSDKNYFAGLVGIGTTTPAAMLEVNGTAKFDAAVTFGGGVTYTGNISTNGQLISTVATGTAPLQVTSTTQVANLNASLLDGLAASAFQPAGSYATLGANTFTGDQTINGNLNLTGSINSALILQGNVTDPNTGNTSANVIAGFAGNTVTNSATGATIAGGGENGAVNSVTADFGTVGGGIENTAGGFGSTLGGGYANVASGVYSTVVGGSYNTASGYLATVAGGYNSTANGQYSMVAGGKFNTASGAVSFAGGLNANAFDSGSFVWCQNQSNPCNSLGTNSFEVAVVGPIFFYDGAGGQGCFLSTNSGSWSCSSDRNLKNNIVPIDSRSVLELVAQMPISQWSMKADASGHKHIGPMAQDFYAAFGLGDTDKYIAQGDAQGVALASIQGLYQMVQEKDEQIRKLVQEKEEQIQALKTQLQDLEERIARK